MVPSIIRSRTTAAECAGQHHCILSGAFFHVNHLILCAYFSILERSQPFRKRPDFVCERAYAFFIARDSAGFFFPVRFLGSYARLAVLRDCPLRVPDREAPHSEQNRAMAITRSVRFRGISPSSHGLRV